MTAQLVLSLFPGIGLLDLAFELEGFVVVRGPDVLWGGDIRRFHPPAGKFDGVIGGPPCQAFSRLSHMVRQNGLEPKFGNLIPEFERCVAEAQPQWFLMEEVREAPPPQIADYGVHWFLLNNRQCQDQDGRAAEQNRVRAISFGWRAARRVLPVEVVPLENMRFERAVLGGGGNDRNASVPIKLGGSGKPKKTLSQLNDYVGQNTKSRAAIARMLRLQGLPEGFTEHWPFTVEGACKALGNGVPLPMGRALAKAVREAIGQ